MKRLSRLGILPGLLCLIGCVLTVLVALPNIVWKPRAVHQDPELPVGKPPPLTAGGIDLDGRPLALAEYHGKVVLIDRKGNVVRKINSLRNIERFVQKEVERERPIDEPPENNRSDTNQ